MKENDLKKLRESIKKADMLFLFETIILIVLLLLNIATIKHVLGFLLGYVALKFVYERMYKQYSSDKITVGSNVFINLVIYSIAFLIATMISFESLISAGFVVVTYRTYLLHKFKSLSSY